MKKLAFLCASALALASMQPAVYAATFRPAGNSTMTGVITIGTMTCTVTATLNVPESAPDAHPSSIPYAHPTPAGDSHGHSASITSATFSGPYPCSLGVFYAPVIVDYVSSNLIFRNFGYGPGTFCRADLVGTYAHGTSVTFTNAPLGACTVSGTLSVVPDIDATP